jgi:hypothetical protein
MKKALLDFLLELLFGEYIYWNTAAPAGWTIGSANITLGANAGEFTQGLQAVALGNFAGQNNQGASSIAIGTYAGHTGQGSESVAIGTGAGEINQGENAIAIGGLAGQTNQNNNTIVLNASNVALNTGSTGAFYVKPIRNSVFSSILHYDTTSGEITESTKTFVIQHPTQDDKYLVHACLEGPEAGVYYRGKGEIINNKEVTIQLPDYVKRLANDFTIQITPIYSGEKIEQLYTSEVFNNSFTVYGGNAKFYWLVHGKRSNIETEPLKTETILKGTGPYKWI